MNGIDPRPSTSRDMVVERLRQAIMRRSELRPGSRAHWTNECEIKVLQRDLVGDIPVPATMGSIRHRPAG
jgi:hypothetical protein